MVKQGQEASCWLEHYLCQLRMRETKNWRKLEEIKGLEESIMAIMKYLSFLLKRCHHLSNFFKSKI